MPPSEAIDDDIQLSLKVLVVLSKSYRSIIDKAVKDIRNYDLSPSEFGILDVLYTKGNVSLQQIGDKLLISSGTMTYNVDKLERKGLLIRIPCSEDRRVIYAQLTDKGRELYKRIFPLHSQSVHRMMNSLGREQKQNLIALLKTLGKGDHEHDNISDN